MSRKRVWDDAAKLTRPGSAVRCVDVGEMVVVVIEPFTPPATDAFVPGELAALAFIVAVGYPDAEPDPTGFYVLPLDLKLAGGSEKPRSTSEADLLGRRWLKFSWAPKGAPWDPAKDTLETHVANIEGRFLRRD